MSCDHLQWLFFRYKNNVVKLLEDTFGSEQSVPQFMEQYMTEMYRLKYAEKPDISRLMKLFECDGDPTLTLEWIPSQSVQVMSNALTECMHIASPNLVQFYAKTLAYC